MSDAGEEKAPAALAGDAGRAEGPTEVSGGAASETSPTDDVVGQVLAYLRGGRQPIPLNPQSKEPLSLRGLPEEIRAKLHPPAGFRSFRWKQDRIATEEDVHRFFCDGINVALLLGEPSNGLCDVDIDIREALPFADALLGDMPAFGRASRPRSHRLFSTDAVKKRTTFELTGTEAKALNRKPSDDKLMLVELRGNGHYTMFPPSTHPLGERVAFDQTCPTTPPVKDWADVERTAGLVAALTVIRLAYPQEAGCRDEVCLALTGALLSAGVEPREADRLVGLVARVAGDEEAGSRGNKAAATREKMDADEPWTGLPKLCELLGIGELEKKLRKWLGMDAPTGDAILLAPGRMQRIFEQSQRALVKAKVPIYQRGAELTRPVVLNPRMVQADEVEAGTLSEGIEREDEATVLLPVTPHYLLRQMSSAAIYLKYSRGKLVAADPQLKHANMILDGAGDWLFPVVRGIVSCPTLRPDLSVLQEPGYDPASRLILDTRGVAFPPVPESPTKDDAATALAKFDAILCGFPFVNEAARAVAYSAILTAVARPALATAPLHAFDAPTPGTGKSKLAEVGGILATGGRPPAIGQGSTVEEFEKRLSTLLRMGDAVIFIDNIERPLESDFLCSALTQERVQCRILGKSERFEVPNTATILATGNNLVFAGDVTRRAVVCRIDARMERPDERQFDFDPTVVAREHRPELVVAALTAIRAYAMAGRPCPLPVMGSFESWNLVRETLVWLGHADPAETRSLVYDSDTRRDTLADMLRLWYACFGEEPLSLSAVGAACEKNTHDETHRMLHAALIDMTPSNMWNTRSVGKALRRCRDRIVGGLMLRRAGEGSQGAKWCVVATDSSVKQPMKPDPTSTQATEDLPF